jgi:purine-binding chemotaxis protein CheW
VEKSMQLPAKRNNSQQELIERILAVDEPEETSESLPAIPEEEIELLVFKLSSETYGIEIHSVAEIIRYAEPTYVPHTVTYLDGIISLRGRMVPVINARKRLGHGAKEPDKKSRIIILQEGGEYHGLLVDSATQVVKAPRSSIEPTPPVVVGVSAIFINGICHYKNQMIILLDLHRFMELL